MSCKGQGLGADFVEVADIYMRGMYVRILAEGDSQFCNTDSLRWFLKLDRYCISLSSVCEASMEFAEYIFLNATGLLELKTLSG